MLLCREDIPQEWKHNVVETKVYFKQVYSLTLVILGNYIFCAYISAFIIDIDIAFTVLAICFEIASFLIV